MLRPDEPDMGNASEGSFMTQIDAARQGKITSQMYEVACKEGLDPQLICERVAQGHIAIPANTHHRSLVARGVGEGLSTKVNVNLGISGDRGCEQEEWEKVDLAFELDADAIMDLTNTGKTRDFRRALIARSSLMIGTVPVYDAVGLLEKPLVDLRAEDFLSVVATHAQDGVDFVTIHAGMTRSVVSAFRKSGRLTNIVSRGGSLLFAWMEATGNENPFYEYFDEVLSILHEHDVTVSLGDAMRPGSLYDATDAAQIAELIEIASLTRRAWDAGVQVMVEGPGHMALDEIAANMKLEKRLCHQAPFYVLEPLVIDCAPGYDHIAAAIGGALAASAGADFLCAVTPAEHVRLPTVDDVRAGLVATKIAAHAGDCVKGGSGARQRDNAMSDARRRINWEDMFDLALDPPTARSIFDAAPPQVEGTCTMCGSMCAMRTVNAVLQGSSVDIGSTTLPC